MSSCLESSAGLGFSEPHGSDFNGTLLLNAEGNLCVDPVDPTMQKEAATQLDALLAVRGE